MAEFIIGLIAGAASPTQASVNARIREDFRSPYVTSIVNFISSIVILAIVILIAEGDLALPIGKAASEPFWIWLGGACGTAIVTLNIVCLPKLGSAKNVMLICFGQIMTGLVVDHFGLFYSPQAPMSLRRAAGAVLVFIGILLVNGIARKNSTDADDNTNSASVLFYSILAVFCGFACAAQVAINGALKECTGSALKTTMISMIVALITAVIVAVVIIVLKGRYGIYDNNDPQGRSGFKFWMPSGGALAVIIVGGNAVAAPVIGTGICTILNLVGMMAAGLVIDATGFLGIEKKPVTLAKVAGMVLMTAGAAIISL